MVFIQKKNMFFDTSYVTLLSQCDSSSQFPIIATKLGLVVKILDKKEGSKGVPLNILAEQLRLLQCGLFVVLLDYQTEQPSWEVAIAIAMELKINQAMAVYSKELSQQDQDSERKYVVVSTTNRNIPLHGVIAVKDGNAEVL